MPGCRAVSDIVDRAQELEERQRDAALARVRHAGTSIRFPAGGPRACERCGVTIPDARLMAIPDTQHCVTCQDAIERGIAR